MQDVIKSKIQTDGFSGSEQKYRGVIDCARQIWAKEGVKGFYRGFVPCMVRCAPANAGTFLG